MSEVLTSLPQKLEQPVVHVSAIDPPRSVQPPYLPSGQVAVQSGPQAWQPSALPQQARRMPESPLSEMQESGQVPVPGSGGLFWANTGIAKAIPKIARTDSFIVSKSWVGDHRYHNIGVEHHFIYLSLT